MAVGFPTKVSYANGDVFSASDINDTNGTINLLTSSTLSRIGGKNALINGAFDYWQRGTTGFTFGGAYNADRWKYYCDGTAVTATVTQQALAAGAIVGVDSPYCFQWSVTVAGTGATTSQLYQLVEDVRTLAGQTAVLSFYAKSDATRTAVAPTVNQNFGSGGSATVGATVTAVSGNPTNLTTSWQRFSYTVALASITGKTVGTSSYVEVGIKLPINTTQVTQVVGAQLELGSYATTFSRAGGTIQGELAACQRYYYRQSAVTGQEYAHFGLGSAINTSNVNYLIFTPVTMRTSSLTLDYSTLAVYDGNTVTSSSASVIIAQFASPNTVALKATTAATLTQYRPYFVIANNSATAYVGISAEL
jgi:hypothetical protein